MNDLTEHHKIFRRVNNKLPMRPSRVFALEDSVNAWSGILALLPGVWLTGSLVPEARRCQCIYITQLMLPPSGSLP